MQPGPGFFRAGLSLFRQGAGIFYRQASVGYPYLALSVRPLYWPCGDGEIASLAQLARAPLL